MDVSLYVYDLSQGLARQMSMQFLGIQIDAVYHTSIVFQDTEYFFGRGIQMCRAGMSHHGRPIQIVSLGKTDLPLDVIEDYLGALRDTYHAESYDLFMHNCNNFSHDFAQFLVGKGIPDHITNLPRQVLNTPFGRMLQPQLDASMRSVTQAPVPAHAVPNGNVQSPDSASVVPEGHAQTSNTTTPANGPGHPHHQLNLPLLFGSDMADCHVEIDEYPRLRKLRDLVGGGNDESLTEIVDFTEKLWVEPNASIPLPNLGRLYDRVQELWPSAGPKELEQLLELLNIAFIGDQRVCTFFADREKSQESIGTMLEAVNTQEASHSEVQRATLQLTCTLITSPPIRDAFMSCQQLNAQVIDLVTRNLLGSNAELQEHASRAAFAACSALRRETHRPDEQALIESRQVELAVAMIEVLSNGTSQLSCAERVVRALGILTYLAPLGGELLETCASLDAGKILQEAGNSSLKTRHDLCYEVASLFRAEIHR